MRRERQGGEGKDREAMIDFVKAHHSFDFDRFLLLLLFFLYGIGT